MNNKISIWISSLALVISIATLLIFWVRFEPFTLDSNGFFGWVTCVFALLVTILVGWQIFNVISINKQVDDKVQSMQIQTNLIKESIFSMFDKEKKDLQRVMDRKDIELFYAISMIMVNRFSKSKNYQIKISYLVLALNAAVQLNSKERVDTILSTLSNSLQLKESIDSMDQDLITEIKEELENAAKISSKACEVFAML